MKPLDRFLQRWRMRVAMKEFAGAATVLDIGCHRGELRSFLPSGIKLYRGVDRPVPSNDPDLVDGWFPQDLPSEVSSERWEIVVALAVAEHLSRDDRFAFFSACRALLRPTGRVVLTVPSPAVDRILDLLVKLHLVEGMDLDHHHGASVGDILESAEAAGLTPLEHHRFQFGLNNVVVLVAAAPETTPEGDQDE